MLIELGWVVRGKKPSSVHHGVCKKSTLVRKLRIVFDATAEYNGKSLNQFMLTGPKLQKELPEILLKFRQRPIAIGTYIKSMFNRIRLTKEDARYHKFLMTHPIRKNRSTLTERWIEEPEI